MAESRYKIKIEYENIIITKTAAIYIQTKQYDAAKKVCLEALKIGDRFGSNIEEKSRYETLCFLFPGTNSVLCQPQ